MGGQVVRTHPTPRPPRNCQIINFCHVGIFRQTPSGNLDPPPEKMFWIRAWTSLLKCFIIRTRKRIETSPSNRICCRNVRESAPMTKLVRGILIPMVPGYGVASDARDRAVSVFRCVCFFSRGMSPMLFSVFQFKVVQ